MAVVVVVLLLVYILIALLSFVLSAGVSQMSMCIVKSERGVYLEATVSHLDQGIAIALLDIDPFTEVGQDLLVLDHALVHL